jgi:hypothetical protein
MKVRAGFLLFDKNDAKLRTCFPVKFNTTRDFIFLLSADSGPSLLSDHRKCSI